MGSAFLIFRKKGLVFGALGYRAGCRWFRSSKKFEDFVVRSFLRGAKPLNTYEFSNKFRNLQCSSTAKVNYKSATRKSHEITNHGIWCDEGKIYIFIFSCVEQQV